MGRDPAWAAPEHWKVEVFSVARGLALAGKVSDDLALRAIGRIGSLGVETVPVDDLLAEMWRVRSNISAYDAAYVALAHARGLTLMTADAKLAQAAVAHCRVELVA
jgi:predicted nucleic acid-binding protein